MSAKLLHELQGLYPGRVMLRVDEVAYILRGRVSWRITERIRNNLKAGIYGQGAKVLDGIWQLPLSDLADYIDPPPLKLRPMPNTKRVSSGRRGMRNRGPRVF